VRKHRPTASIHDLALLPSATPLVSGRLVRRCVEVSSGGNTQHTEAGALHFYYCAYRVGSTLRKLQRGSYTQDTDENREYLQKQIPPMQNGQRSPSLRA